MKSINFFNYMEYVYTVYQERSFTRAAEKLFISQPALSFTIKKVENELGQPIFERSGKEIKPTFIGLKYIKAIEDTMRIQANFNVEIDDILKLKNGKITIGCTYFIADYILPRAISKFRKIYPNIEIVVVAEDGSTLESHLDNDSIDIIIGNSAVFLEQYKYVPLTSERVFVGAAKHITEKLGLSEHVIPQEKIKEGLCAPLSENKIKIDTLRNEKFILMSKGSKMRQMAKQMFGELKIIPNVTMEYVREETAIRFCEEGFGICFVSEKSVRFSNICSGIDLFLPNTDYPDFELYLIRKKSRYLPEAIREFTEHFKDFLKNFNSCFS